MGIFSSDENTCDYPHCSYINDYKTQVRELTAKILVLQADINTLKILMPQSTGCGMEVPPNAKHIL